MSRDFAERRADRTLVTLFNQRLITAEQLHDEGLVREIAAAIRTEVSSALCYAESSVRQYAKELLSQKD